MGGKSRISKPISEVISAIPRWKIENSETNCPPDFAGGGYNTLVSLFCGSCSVESKVTGYTTKILNDNHEYLIALLNGVKDGYELPEHISEEEYRYIRLHKDEDKVLTGFVGFGCSFGGKWFGGYARNKTGTNYALQSKKSLLKDMESLMSATFLCKDYRNVELPAGCVVYADPPYNGTTGYGKTKFDSDVFWQYMREISKKHIVFISEQNAPSDFISIWEKPFTRTLDVNKNNQFKVTEKLFIHECNRDKITKR
jgi:DNA adenine methylase